MMMMQVMQVMLLPLERTVPSPPPRELPRWPQSRWRSRWRTEEERDLLYDIAWRTNFIKIKYLYGFQALRNMFYKPGRCLASG